MTRTILINNSILTLYEIFFWESKRNLFHSAHVKCVFELVKLSQVDVWEKVCISNIITYVCKDTFLFKRPSSHQSHVSKPITCMAVCFIKYSSGVNGGFVSMLMGLPGYFMIHLFDR